MNPHKTKFGSFVSGAGCGAAGFATGGGPEGMPPSKAYPFEQLTGKQTATINSTRF